MKKLCLSFLLFLCVCYGQAQERKNMFNHLDIAFTAGSTGLGFDFSMPAGEYLRVRTGGTFMPHFEYKMKFSVGLINTDPDNPGQTVVNKDHFDNLNTLFSGFTGSPIADHVDMLGSPTFHNFKLMLDVFPFKKKNWHATVGFYAGGERVAKAYNTNEAMVSLFSVKMYNDMYWRSINHQPIIDDFEFSPVIQDKFEEYGTMAMNVGYFKEDYYARQDILWDHDVWVDDMDSDSPTFLERICLHQKGDVRFAKGELAYQKGEPYLMLPDMSDNMVKCRALVNKVRPYLGIGYSGALSRDRRTQISVQAGAMMWGGVPQMLTHDGIDLARDLDRLDGQVKRYIDLAKKLKVFPVFELRFSQRIF